MKKINVWISLLSFSAGSFVCYLTLQFRHFEIKKELDVPNLILSVLTLFIGLYIADTLQRRVNKYQNQHSYLLNKFDPLWLAFIDFSEKIKYDTKIDVSYIRSLNKNVINPISFLKIVFNSFDVNDTCISNLERSLENLESILSNSPSKDNIVNYSEAIGEIENKIKEINQSFSSMLKEIQNL